MAKKQGIDLDTICHLFAMWQEAADALAAFSDADRKKVAGQAPDLWPVNLRSALDKAAATEANLAACLVPGHVMELGDAEGAPGLHVGVLLINKRPMVVCIHRDEAPPRERPSRMILPRRGN